MGTLVIGTLGVCAFLGAGMTLSSAFHYFHEFKPSNGKRKGGDSDDVVESLRKRTGSIG